MFYEAHLQKDTSQYSVIRVTESKKNSEQCSEQLPIHCCDLLVTSFLPLLIQYGG